MKHYYCEIIVGYTMPEEDGDGPYEMSKSYQEIIIANSLTEAKAKGISIAVMHFEENENDGFEDVRYSIEQCYETTDDARPN